MFIVNGRIAGVLAALVLAAAGAWLTGREPAPVDGAPAAAVVAADAAPCKAPTPPHV